VHDLVRAWHRHPVQNLGAQRLLVMLKSRLAVTDGYVGRDRMEALGNGLGLRPARTCFARGSFPRRFRARHDQPPIVRNLTCVAVSRWLEKLQRTVLRSIGLSDQKAVSAIAQGPAQIRALEGRVKWAPLLNENYCGVRT